MAKPACGRSELCFLWLVGLAFSALDSLHVALQLLYGSADIKGGAAAHAAKGTKCMQHCSQRRHSWSVH